MPILIHAAITTWLTPEGEFNHHDPDRRRQLTRALKEVRGVTKLPPLPKSLWRLARSIFGEQRELEESPCAVFITGCGVALMRVIYANPNARQLWMVVNDGRMVDGATFIGCSQLHVRNRIRLTWMKTKSEVHKLKSYKGYLPRTRVPVSISKY